MATIADNQVVKFLGKVIFEAGRRGDFFIQQRDYDRLMAAIDEVLYLESILDGDVDWDIFEPSEIDDTILIDAIRLAKQYGIEIPEECKEIKGLVAQSENVAIERDVQAGTKPKDWSPKQFTDDDPAFIIEGWEALGIKNGKEIDAESMARHFLILGETGSGKTASGVKPLLRSILNYESLKAERASVLVIDPKAELCEFVEKVMGGRFDQETITLDLDKDQYRIDVFERERTDGRCNLSAFDVIELVKPFSEDILSEAKASHDRYWVNKPLAMIMDVLEVILHCYKEGIDFWAEFTKQSKIAGEKEKKEEKSKGVKSKDLLRCRFYDLVKQLNFKYNPSNFFLPMKRFFDLMGGWSGNCMETFENTCEKLKVPVHLSVFTTNIKQMMSAQLIGTLMTIAPRYLTGLTSHKLVRHLWLNPIEAPENSLRIEDAVNDGKVLIYSPGDNSFVSDAIGKLLKARFFKATFTRKNKNRPVAYVCDEFQRFITGDTESGEQAFLDRCRAYRGICVLATQSIASIQKALYNTGEPNNSAEACISIILNNTGTKLFFRNTDIETQNRLKALIPKNTMSDPSGNSHIIEARPISTLGVGECYFLLSNSTWGRAQISIGQRGQDKSQTNTFASAYCKTLKLMNNVTPKSIVKLCSEIDSAVYYYSYRHIKIEICSPGGELLALQHYLSRLAEWRSLGVIVETVAIMSVASAAAIILSLGDVGYRSAYPVAKLLYHNGGFKPSSFCTKEDFAQFASELQRIDSHLQTKLIKHIYGDDDNAPKFKDLIDMFALRERELNGERMNHYLSKLDGMNDDEAKNPSRKQYETVLKELFEKDIHIDPKDAKLLGLIDNVLE
ncbi:MAG: DUF87 domain-containing protein [Holophagales bacterium]|nr:DUF87 domain-containing protein [Holophagales bacterium]